MQLRRHIWRGKYRLPASAIVAFMLAAACQENHSQIADDAADVSVTAPTYAIGTGPRLVIDGAHNNFHTIDGRYAPFAGLVTNDGFQVSGSTSRFTDSSLSGVDILVIANAIAAENEEEWGTPAYSAFAPDEIVAVERYVARGGSLLLIADHMPFGGAAHDLGAALGVNFDNSFAQDDDDEPDLFTRDNGGLSNDPLLVNVTQLRNFTGSSFTVSAPQARPLIHLGPRWTIRLPAVAWEFTNETPTVSGEGRLQGAVLQHGQGRIAVFGEAAMFTAQTSGPDAATTGFSAPGAEDNKQFLLTILHWLADSDAS